LLTAASTQVGYTGVYNVLDYACMSFPTGITVDQAIDVPQGDTYQPLSDMDKVVQSECRAKNQSDIYTIAPSFTDL
jgi:hypothetical protein